MNVDEFIQTKKIKSSKLIPFYEDILKIQKAGLGLKSVVEYLKMNGVETTISNVSKFLQRRAKTPKKSPKTTTLKSTEAPSKNEVKKVEVSKVALNAKPDFKNYPTSSSEINALVSELI